MNFSEFRGFSPDFDSLSSDIKSSLNTVIFSKRNDDLSVCVVTNNADVFKRICNVKLPKTFFSNSSNRWGVDLESLKTDKVRVYSFLPKQKSIRLYGYYLDKSGVILEKKIYKDNNPKELIIDRYDGNDNLINASEIEKECHERNWTGPKDLINRAKIYQYDYVCLQKTFKNQTYLVIHNKKIIEQNS